MVYVWSRALKNCDCSQHGVKLDQDASYWLVRGLIYFDAILYRAKISRELTKCVLAFCKHPAMHQVGLLDVHVGMFALEGAILSQAHCVTRHAQPAIYLIPLRTFITARAHDMIGLQFVFHPSSFRIFSRLQLRNKIIDSSVLLNHIFGTEHLRLSQKNFVKFLVKTHSRISIVARRIFHNPRQIRFSQLFYNVPITSEQAQSNLIVWSEFHSLLL